MAAAIAKPGILVAACLCLTPLAATAQTSGDSTSERGMPEKTGTPPADTERAMQKPEKK